MRLHQRRRIDDAIDVVDGELDLRAGLLATGLLRGASGKDTDDARAPVGEDDFDGAAEAGAIGQQENHGRNAPRHAQHGERGAAAVVSHRLVGLRQQISHHGYSCLRASTGCNMAALRAGYRPGDDSGDRQRSNGDRGRHDTTCVGGSNPGAAPHRHSSMPMSSAAPPMPIPPLISVRNAPSRKNCSRMLRLVAPSALRRPISRVRSLTATSMMLMMPIAPRVKRHQSDAAEEDVHHVEDLAHGLGILDRVPIFEGVFVVRIEAVIAGDDLAHFLAGQLMLVAHPWPVVDERNRFLLLLAFQREELVHHGVGQEDAIVGGVVVAVSDALDDSHHLESEFRSAESCCRRRSCLPGKRFFSISSPITHTNRFWASSASFSQRPAASGR